MKVLIALETCETHKAQADYCENTWAQRLPEGWDFKRCTGEAMGVPDDYRSLPNKTKAIIDYAYANNYDWLMIVDDDTYLRTDRLKVPDEGIDYAGWVYPPVEVTTIFCSGGCYWLSRRSIETLAKLELDTSKTGAFEDVWVAYHLKLFDIHPTHLSDWILHPNHPAAHLNPTTSEWTAMAQIPSITEFKDEA